MIENGKEEFTEEDVIYAFSFTTAGLNGSNAYYSPSSRKLLKLVLDGIRKSKLKKKGETTSL